MNQFIGDIRLSRRGFGRLVVAGASIAALGPLGRNISTAYGAPQTRKRFVIVNCYGGNDTLNMLPPVTLTPYFTRRVGLALQQNQLLALGGPNATSKYMLHPSMPKTAAAWAAGDVAAVNRVGYPTPDLSHFVSQDIYSLGVRNTFSALGIPQSGWVARYCDHYAPTALGAVAVGVGRPLDIVGGATNPLPVSTLSAFKLQGAGANGTSYTPAYYHRQNYANKLIGSFEGTGRPQSQKEALADAHSLTDQVQTALTAYSSTVTYPNTTLGKSLKDIATLVQGGFETSVFYTGFSGFDTHSAQGTTAGQQPGLFAQIDDAVDAFAKDMQAMNAWNDMVIALITEFGRRNYVNGSGGTDHGHGYAMLLIGGAVNGGVKGQDLVDADLNGEYPTYATDFRSIYKEIVKNHLGADPAPVFPETLPIDGTLGVV